MRSFEERPESVDGRSIDRLVDGELSASERRELLLRLENDPEGWRRCALAFLEDQAWRQAFGAVASADPKPLPTTGSTTPEPARTGKSWLRQVSIAATILASTFASGFASRGFIRSTPRLDLAKADLPGPTTVPLATRPDEIREVGSFDLLDGSAGESAPQRYPILAGPGLDDQWLRSQPPSVPDYVRARWERQGYQVAERRKLMSVLLEDGRQVSIPVDEVEVDYVGQQPL
jgi:hypothetical protein